MVTTPLRQRMLQALRIRNLSPRTTSTYISLVFRFALFFHRSPDRPGLPEIERYLFLLRDEKKVSYCLFNQTVSALRFFYLHAMDPPDLVLRIPYGRREKHLPSSSRSARPSPSSRHSALYVTAYCSQFFTQLVYTSARPAAFVSTTSTRHACSSISVRPRDARTALSRSLPSPSNCSVSDGARPVLRDCSFPARPILSVPSPTPPSSAPSSPPSAVPVSPSVSRHARSVIRSPPISWSRG